MKLITTILSGVLLFAGTITAQVAINTDDSQPDASAMLDVKSTDKGFLPPRMTETQMNAITSPAAGLMVYCTDCSPKGPYFYNGAAFISIISNFMSFSFSDVTNPNTSEIWMDRNLGASQVATSSTDAASYGYLYQWGRGTDGHQIRTSGTSSTLSSSDTPGHGDFITNSSSSPYDWRSPQNDNLWQGTSGTNNPCPSGYRLPTAAEWEAERQDWGSNNNATGAYASPLKLPVAGFRSYSNGGLTSVGTNGYYWSSTVNSIKSSYLYFTSGDASLYTDNRAYGLSVRCIKD